MSSGTDTGADRPAGQPPSAQYVAEIGRHAHALVEELYPFCRSLTGDGVRQTLRALQKVIPLQIREVPTGTRAYDWTVPNEWHIEDAYVLDSAGRRVVDFRASSLHVVGNSSPIDARVSREELLKHLHTDPAHPDWIPYRHTYYRESWGFCAAHQIVGSLTEPEYRVRIDSRLEPGNLTYGEFFVPGREDGEILISTHTCHPSLCNDNLSGITVAALLARDFANTRPRYGMRFLFVPATLGPLVWMSRNENVLPSIRAGFVLAGVGDRGKPTYTRSRRGNAMIDRATIHVIHHTNAASTIRDFAPNGYDQRQYCSPGFDLPIGCLMRTPNGEYPEYHFSADNPSLVAPEGLGDSWRIVRQAVDIVQEDRRYLNLLPKGEPRLGARGLFADAERLGMLWTLNFSDGTRSLLDIAERSGMPFWLLHEGAQRLIETGLLRELNEEAA
jgi:aminopeptidase-like protein